MACVKTKAREIFNHLRTDIDFNEWFDSCFYDYIYEALTDWLYFLSANSDFRSQSGRCYCPMACTKSRLPFIQRFDESDFRKYFGSDLVDSYLSEIGVFENEKNRSN